MSQAVASALVQGSSRGLGLQFCRSLLSRQPQMNIIATCRSPNSAPDLQALKDDPNFTNRLHVLQMDIKNESHIKVT